MAITSAVWEGGGAKGVAYARIPKALEKMGELKNIKRVAGSSCGSIMALFFALGYTPAQIDKTITELDLKKFTGGNLLRLLWVGGWSSGKKLAEWLRWKIRLKTGNENTTFQQLFEKRGIYLIVTGTNLTDKRTEYFSYKTTPDMELWKAVRISCALPLAFEPVIHNEKNGFKFAQKTNPNTTKRVCPWPSGDMIARIVFLMADRVYEYSSYDERNRTATIDVGTMESTEFELSGKRKRQLKIEGYNATIATIKRIRRLEEASCDSEIIEPLPLLGLFEKARMRLSGDAHQPA
jgi:hypothetical protein